MQILTFQILASIICSALVCRPWRSWGRKVAVTERMKTGRVRAERLVRRALAALCALSLLVLAAAGAVFTGDEIAKDGETVPVQSVEIQTENIGWQEEETNPLAEASDPGIAEAVRAYYGNRTEDNPFAEEYRDLQTFVKRGRYADTYLAFVRYDMKLQGIYTLVPGLETLYLEADPDGEPGAFAVSGEFPDAEAASMAAVLAGHSDVQRLIRDVQAAYEKAAASDALLSETLRELESRTPGA